VNESQRLVAFTVPDHLRWLAEGGRVLIVDRQGERSWLLDGQEAVLWQRLPQESSFHGLIQHRIHLYSEDTATAETSVRTLWDQWLKEGLLIPLEGKE